MNALSKKVLFSQKKIIKANSKNYVTTIPLANVIL